MDQCWPPKYPLCNGIVVWILDNGKRKQKIMSLNKLFIGTLNFLTFSARHFNVCRLSRSNSSAIFFSLYWKPENRFIFILTINSKGKHVNILKYLYFNYLHRFINATQ